MKPLFFAISLLFTWQSIASDETAQKAEPQTKAEQETKSEQKTEKSVPALEFIEGNTTATHTDARALKTDQQTTTEQAVNNPQEPVTTETAQPKVVAEEQKAAAQVDDSKVLGTQTPVPAEKPKTAQAKQEAVAEAEKAVNQAKEALTAKQQEKARQSRESMAVIEQVIAAYNARNIEAFIKMYDENVEFYAFPNELMFTGKEKLIARYGIMFKKLKCIKSSPIKRIVLGNIVIDHELSETCSQDPNVVDKRSEFVTSYQIENGKITKVLFFR
ncbi:nuclear transport factor 2 family protein [Pseudoalteromonas sp. JSTW]|uniref:nuclear transport factor 2 family protein n=1 Tax=Pseudoalteromonas sp. JSTW TaxID=2752475 RepID=UPI0015D553DA|nr:nuclear transport factor 2 family protein [Pseudoalteromonas sp. JSTW]QLJ10274.1 hypothetical protein GZH31_19845 [Pseudoalteromonas sp. JSTW]